VVMYIRLYLLILKQSLIRESQFPAQFWSSFVGWLAELAIRIGFFGAIYVSGVISISGWSLPEIIFLQAVASLVSSIWAFFFGANIGAISRLVRTGRLDHLLLMPVDGQFYMSLRRSNLASLLSSLATLPLFFWCVPRLSVTFTLGLMLRFLLLVICGICVYYVLSFLPSILSFWIVDPASIQFLFHEVLSYAHYPSDIYQSALKAVLTYVFPLLLIANEAAAEVIGHSGVIGLVPAVAISVLGLITARICYRAGLRRYTGASV